MKRIRTVTSAALLAGTLIIPLAPAFAADLTVNVDASTTAASMGVVTVSASGAVDASSTGTTTGNMNDQNADTGMMVSGGTAGTLTLMRSDVDSSAGSASVTDAAMVSTSADLDAYARGVLSSDTNVKTVAASATEVSVSYPERAWFLGFIPMTVTATATVDANGDASVSYPWYRFLSRTDKANVQAEVDAAASSMGNATDASASFDARAQARLISGLQMAMKRAHDASVGASASASANAAAGASY